MDEPTKKAKLDEGVPVPAVMPPEQANVRAKPKLQPKKKVKYRKCGKTQWVDQTLEEWPEDDYRAYICNLGHEVTEDVLWNAFRKFKSLQKVKVVYDHNTGRSRGYGFLSFAAESDYVAAVTQWDGKHVGNRPVRITRSTWKQRAG